MGWSEYRTGGKDFRATISWDEQAVGDSADILAPSDADEAALTKLFTLPNVIDVLEAVLIGSIKTDLELNCEQECEAYRRVLKAVEQRVTQFQECYA